HHLVERTGRRGTRPTDNDVVAARRYRYVRQLLVIRVTLCNVDQLVRQVDSLLHRRHYVGVRLTHILGESLQRVVARDYDVDGTDEEQEEEEQHGVTSRVEEVEGRLPGTGGRHSLHCAERGVGPSSTVVSLGDCRRRS